MAYHCRVQNRGHEMVIPLIFFLDKTHIDAHGRLMQEPLCMTLGCFERKTRMISRAWRILGYIPNQSAHVTAKDPRDKLEDYHFVLQHVLQSLSEFQSKGPFYCEFPRNAVKDETQRSSGYFYTFFANLQGDIPGHNAACGHFNSCGGNVKHVCCQCDIPHEKLADPFHVPQLLTQKQMTNCSINPVTKKPQCNKWGYHALPNGTCFDSLDFGLPKNSPFQHTTFRTAFDVQHTDCKGNMEHSVLGFHLLLKQGKFTGDEQQSEEFLMFSKATKEIVEKAMLIWDSLYQCQSNRSLPRTYFPQGPLSTDKLNCHEYPGISSSLLDLSLFHTGRHAPGNIQRHPRSQQAWHLHKERLAR
jgi:hypothetical protein